MTAMTRLSLLSAEPDSELDRIRGIIQTFEDAHDMAGALAILEGHVSRDERVDVLDLIGHSRSPGFLVIGTWVIDGAAQTAATFSVLFRPLLADLGVRTIRLLGCSTAGSSAGRIAMRRVAQAARCQVYGTTRYISRNDYASAGFRSTDCLIDAQGARAIACGDDSPEIVTWTRSETRVRS